MFYVAPFALIALARARRATASCRARRRASWSPRSSPACCRSFIPFARFVTTSAVSDTLRAAAVVVGCRTTGSTSDQVRWAALAVGARRRRAVRARCRGGTRSSCRRSSRVYFVLDGVRGRERPARDPPGLASARSGPASACRTRDWIDRAVGRDADVAFLWHDAGDDAYRSGRTSSSTAASARSTTSTAPTPPDPLPETAGRTSAPTARCVDRGRAVVRAQYVLVDGSTDVDGHARRARPGVGVDALPRRRPARACLTRVTGLYPNDTWSGPTVTYRRARLHRRHASRCGLGSDPLALRRAPRP